MLFTANVKAKKRMRNEYDFLADFSHRISGLSAEVKNKLFAIWMSKERLEGSKTLEIMFALDDEWERVYQEYRIKEGFSAATLRANERLLAIVYGG
jgi:hypothetical protein